MCVYKTEDGKCKKYSDGVVTSYCVEGPCPDDTPTNNDRLNAMSVEEKALWLYHGQDPITGPLNLQGILDWLNSPEKGE